MKLYAVLEENITSLSNIKIIKYQCLQYIIIDYIVYIIISLIIYTTFKFISIYNRFKHVSLKTILHLHLIILVLIFSYLII